MKKGRVIFDPDAESLLQDRLESFNSFFNSEIKIPDPYRAYMKDLFQFFINEVVPEGRVLMERNKWSYKGIKGVWNKHPQSNVCVIIGLYRFSDNLARTILELMIKEDDQIMKAGSLIEHTGQRDNYKKIKYIDGHFNYHKNFLELASEFFNDVDTYLDKK